MKLKVIFLKKKHLYITIGVLILILISIFFVTIKPKKNSVSTFNIMSKDKIFKTDLTGDGREDLLYVKTKKDKYYVQINTKDNQTLFLEPDKKINSLGTYSENWPMRLSLKDINRDNIPEIFIQSSQNQKPIQHIFIWDKKEFKDVFYSYNNLLGFMDYSNNRTPKFISGNFKNGKITFNNYILVGSDLRNFNESNNENFAGKNTVNKFINLFFNSDIKNDSLEKYLTDICFSDSSAEVQKVLSQINLKEENIHFQDGFFKDSRYNSKGEISEITWVLNFRGEKKDSKENKNYTFSLYLKPSNDKKDKFYFKIKNISLSPLE